MPKTIRYIYKLYDPYTYSIPMWRVSITFNDNGKAVKFANTLLDKGGYNVTVEEEME